MFELELDLCSKLQPQDCFALQRNKKHGLGDSELDAS